MAAPPTREDQEHGFPIAFPGLPNGLYYDSFRIRGTANLQSGQGANTDNYIERFAIAYREKDRSPSSSRICTTEYWNESPCRISYLTHMELRFGYSRKIRSCGAVWCCL